MKKNKIIFMMITSILVFGTIHSIYLLSNKNSVKFTNYLNILYIIIIGYLVIFYIYSTTIRLIYNKIITKSNNEKDYEGTLKSLRKLNKLYLPARIRKETKNSLELIEKLDKVQKGIANLG
jgi:hypothetical protein